MSKKKPKVKTTIISSAAMGKVLFSNNALTKKTANTITRGQWLYCQLTSENRADDWYKIIDSLDNETQALVESLGMTQSSVILQRVLGFTILAWDRYTTRIYTSSDGTYWNIFIAMDTANEAIRKILSADSVTLIDVSEIEPLMCLYS